MGRFLVKKGRGLSRCFYAIPTVKLYKKGVGNVQILLYLHRTYMKLMVI